MILDIQPTTLQREYVLSANVSSGLSVTFNVIAGSVSIERGQ
jgi:hypothetical protein